MTNDCEWCGEVLTKISVCSLCGMEYADKEQIDNNALRKKLANYEKLLSVVENKYQDETRFDTALRYLTERVNWGKNQNEPKSER